MTKIAFRRRNVGGGWRGRAAVALAFAVGCVGLGFDGQNDFSGVGVGGNVALATEYFLDSAGGNDANDGKSPETAWRTLERLDKAALEPGDVVRFRRDRVWRGTLRAKSGSEGKPVVYSDYGDGAKPRILQSVDLSSTEFWTKIDDMYDYEKWKEQDFYVTSGLTAYYNEVVNSLDELLKEHGYVRNGRLYETKQGNHDTIAFFCHGGLEVVLLSHLCNISPIPLAHHFGALTSSVTTLYTEERRKGKAVFRCASFGDTGHLYAGGEPTSFAARFCEVYEDDTRHD